MGIVYKFRSIKSLLKHNELFNNELHFSSPEYLNDPMEKAKNFVFNGEEVNWKCLIRTFILDYYFKIIFDGFANNTSVISYYKVSKVGVKSKLVNDVDYITECILSEEFIINKIKEFINNDIPVNTLIDFLYSILLLINKNIVKHLDKIDTNIIKQDYSNIDISKLYDTIKNEGTFNIKYSEMIKYQSRLDTKISLNKALYPQQFIEILISYCFPPYYVLSLASDYSNPSMWSHYADNHEGVCLVFNTETVFDKEYLNIQYLGDKQEVRSVNYNLMSPVNVFTHMGAVGNGIVYCLHNYKNEESKFWSSLKPNEFIKELDLVLVNELGLTKSPDWKNEKEKRIFIRNEDNNKYINLKYDEQQLTGLIFGIKTNEDDEYEIINILKNKKKLNKEFKLYKAFYNFSTDSIDKSVIGIKL